MSRSSITVMLLSCILLALAFACQMIQAIEETKLTIYHQKDGEYIKRGEIIGLPGVPEYIPADNEVVDYNGKDQFYQIKVKDERTGNVILSSIKMCQMVGSDWHDEFTLHLDEENRFYYLSYYPESNYCESNIESTITTKPFNTTVNVVNPVSGPKPLLGNFASKQPVPKTNKASAPINDEIPETKEIEEKTFFQKYWYMILGAGFLFLSMAAGEPPAAPAGAARS